MTDYIIRPMVKDDAENYRELRLRALETNPEAFGSSYEQSQEQSIEFFRNHIPEPGSDNVIFVVEADGQMCGMMRFLRDQHLKMRHKGRIWGVFVNSELRGQGLGRSLLKAVLDHAYQIEGLHHINLSVVTANKAALNLYRSLGFYIWGTKPDALLVNGVYYDEDHMIYKL